MYFSHSDLIETIRLYLLRVNSAMDTRAVYSKMKKHFIKHFAIIMFLKGAPIRK